MFVPRLAVSLLVSLFVVNAATTSLSFQVEPTKEACFSEDLAAGEMVEATVLVYRGGKLDVKLRIEGPSNEKVYEKLIFSNLDEATGKLLPTIVKRGHRFGAPAAGTYRICVDNRMARWTAKVLTLEVAKWNPADGRGDFGLDPSQAPPSEGMRVVAQRLHAKLTQLGNLQLYFFSRERRHRETVESTNSRVQGWSAAKTAVIAVVSMAMVAIVRAWFKRPTVLPGKV